LAWAGITLTATGVLLVWATIWLLVSDNVRRHTDGALRNTANLARSLAAQVGGRISGLDAMLRFGRELQARDPAGFGTAAWAAAWPDPDVTYWGLIGPDGRVIANQDGPMATPLFIQDRVNFLAHQATPGEDRLVIGPPVIGRRSGEVVINVSRPLRSADGRFAGLLMIAVKAESFASLYNSLDLPAARMTLASLDGVILARAGEHIAEVDRLADWAVAPLRDGALERSGRQVSPGDGMDHFSAQHRVAGYPLLVSIGIPAEAVLVGARQERNQLLVLGAVITLLAVTLQWARHQVRREEQHSQTQMQAAFAHVGHGIMLVDADRRIQVVNERVGELLGLPPGLAATGRSLDEVVRWKEATGEFDGSANPGTYGASMALRPGDPPFIAEVTRPNGIVVQIRTDALPDGGHVRSYTDVTLDRRSAEAIAVARDEALEAKAAMAGAFDQAPIGIVVVGADRRIAFINAQAIALLDLPSEIGRIGVEVRDVLRFQMARGDLASTPEVARRAAQALDTQNLAEATYERPTRDGRIIEVRGNRTVDGRTVRTYGDVTEARRAAAEVAAARDRALAAEAGMLGAFAHAPFGVALIDATGRQNFMNETAQRLLDLPAELAAPGVDLRDVIRFQLARGDLDEVPEVAAMARAGLQVVPAPLTPYIRRTRLGGAMEVRAAFLPDGGVVRTYTDVTAREDLLREKDRAHQAAEAALRSRTEFLAVVSHELRTPLNAIIGLSTVLAAASPPEDAATVPALSVAQRGDLLMIEEAGRQLLALIDDILTIAQLERGQLALVEQPFDPAEIIREAINGIRPRAAEKGLGLDVQIPSRLPSLVLGDAGRLRVVLMKLLDNAVKFTDAGDVSVSVTSLAEGAAGLRLAVTVSDTGIGVPAEARDLLFEPFVQADSSASRPFGGLGLGLAICRQLLETIGGSIAYVPRETGGSRFRFELRLGRVRAAGAANWNG
jgi:signal transduction histidine kinase